MFESLTTYSGFSSATFSGSMVSSSFASSSTLGSSFRSSVGTAAPISVRTPDKTLRSFTTAGTFEYVLPKGVGSFVAMHRDNVNSYGSGVQPPRRSITFPGEDYETPPTGELDDSFASPVGDVLLPLLLMAAAYAVVRWFKNWKRERTRKRLFCIK